MLQIKKFGTGGPSIFLTRLERALKKDNLIAEEIFSNIILTDRYVNTDKQLILRLDGLYMNEMTPSELYNFSKNRTGSSIRNIALLNKVLSNTFGLNYSNLVTPHFTNYFFKKLNKLRKDAFDISRHIIYQSNFSKNCWNHFYKTDTPSSIIPNGVNLNDFQPLHNQNNTIYEKGLDLKLLASGNFRIHKRLQDSIELLKNIIEFIPKTKLYVIGNLDLQTKAHIFRIFRDKPQLKKHVVFLGKIKFDDLSVYYANADILLHPSWLDPCPNVVVEALACGLPVVCPSTGGTPELVDRGGIIVEDSFDFGFTEQYNNVPNIDYDKYKEAVLEIYDNIEKYSSRARKQAETNLDIDIISKKYINVIKKYC